MGAREKAALPPGLPLAGTWGALWSSVWGGASGVRHWRSQADPRVLTQGESWVPSSLGVFKLLLESPGDHRAVEEGGAQGQGFNPQQVTPISFHSRLLLNTVLEGTRKS